MKPAAEPVVFSEKEYRFDKVLATILYFAHQPRTKITNLDKKKAITLVFLADKLYLLRYGRPLYGEDYRALPEGIVPQRTLDRLDEFELGKRPGRDIVRLKESLEIKRVAEHTHPVYTPKAKPNMAAISEAELDVINEVIDRYGTKTYSQLDPIIHPPAWEKAWARKPKGKKAWRTLFEELFEGDPDAKAGALEEMLQNSRIKRTLSQLR